MQNECSLCHKPDDLECPACDKLFCINCFVDHGKQCYEASRKQTGQREPEQKEGVCVRCGVDEFNDLFQCEACQQWFCDMHTNACSHCSKFFCPEHYAQHREELSRKAREEFRQKQETSHEKCVECGASWIYLPNSLCWACGQPVCVRCAMEHRNKRHPSHERPEYSFNDDFKRYHALFKNGLISEEQFREYISGKTPGQAKRQQESNTCAHCGMGVFPGTGVTCPACQQYFHSVCYHAFHAETHAPKHANARTTYGSPGFNPNNFRIHVDGINLDELLKNMRDFSWQTTEDATRKAREEAAKKAKEEQERKARAQGMGEEFWRAFFRDNFSQSTHANGDGTYTHTFTPGSASSTLETAFSHLGLSTHATVQEVKRAFRREAKKAHPDTGGSDAAFKALNEAYQKALAHAERNER